MEPEEIEGTDPQQLEDAATAIEVLIAAALAAVAAQAATSMVVMPGVPAVDVNVLGSIPQWWEQRLRRRIMPALRRTVDTVTRRLRGLFDDELERLGETEVLYTGTGMPELFPADDVGPVRPLPDITAEDILAQARNRLVAIGDDLWVNARASLVEGMQQGESVPQLAARVRAAAGVTEPRARVIARTEVISASNSASIAQARSTGIGLDKIWIATEDPRTRVTHREADGQTVPLDTEFTVGGEALDFPGDPTGRADNVINCRCSIGYRMSTPTVAAATPALDTREYVRDNDGQFAKVPGSGVLRMGELERLDTYDEPSFTDQYGPTEETMTVDSFGPLMHMRILEDGGTVLANEFGEGEEKRVQPFTGALNAEDLEEMADALDTARELDPDDYDEDDDDPDGIMDWIEGLDGIKFGRYRNGDIRVTRDQPLDPTEPDQSEMYMFDWGEDDQEAVSDALREAADLARDVSEREPEDEEADRIYGSTDAMGEVYTYPRQDGDGSVEITFSDSPGAGFAMDRAEAQELAGELDAAAEAFDDSEPSETPIFTSSVMDGSLELEAYNSEGTFVVVFRGKGGLSRLGEYISLEDDDPGVVRDIIREALDALAPDGGITTAAVPHLHTCQEGPRPWKPGPCKGWKHDLPETDPRWKPRPEPKPARKPRAKKAEAAPDATAEPDVADTVIKQRQERQKTIDQARSRAGVLAELEQLALMEGASPRLYTQRLNARIRRDGLGEDPVVSTIADAVRTGDTQQIMAAIEEAARKAGLERIGGAPGNPDQVMPFDRTVHRPTGGDIPDGAPAQVVRPGYRYRMAGEGNLLLEKATVEPVGASIVVAAAVPHLHTCREGPRPWKPGPCKGAKRKIAAAPALSPVSAPVKPHSAAPVASKPEAVPRPAGEKAAFQKRVKAAKANGDVRDSLPYADRLEFDRLKFPEGFSGKTIVAALDHFKGLGYRQMNQDLREGKPASAGGPISQMRAAMSASKTGEDGLAYRGIASPEKVFGEVWNPSGDNSGLEWVDRAFVPTSTSERYAKVFAEDVLMTMLVPKGTSAVSMMATYRQGSDLEQELVLADGLKYKIVSDSGPGRRPRRIDVEVVSSD